MARIPFKIDYRPQIESGEYKVVTDCGEPVEVVKWNCKGECPILAVIDDGDVEDTCFFNEAGISPHGTDSLYIITDDIELTKFENMVKQIVTEELTQNCGDVQFGIYIDDKTAHAIGSRVWKLAQAKAGDDLQRQFDNGAVHKGSYNKGYENGKAEAKLLDKAAKDWYEAGKRNALKDMPKWKRYIELNQMEYFEDRDKYAYHRGYRIPISELFDKLPKEN